MERKIIPFWKVGRKSVLVLSPTIYIYVGGISIVCYNFYKIEI